MDKLKGIYEQVFKRDSNEPEFLQAVKEVFDSPGTRRGEVPKIHGHRYLQQNR